MEKSVDFSVMDQIATLVINRPAVHNSFNEDVIDQFIACFEEMNASKEIRVILMTSVGKTFSAGADIEYMKRIATYSMEENLKDAQKLARMFKIIRESPKPVVARVQGPVFGGGVGLIAASDVSIALSSVTFSFTEVKLGIMPAIISPYVVEKTGPGPLHRYCLTAEPFHAEEAKRIGLVSEVVGSMEKLNEKVTETCYALKSNSGQAIAAFKNLLSEVAGRNWEATNQITSRRLAELRHSPEGQEGLQAFLEKRKPRF